MGFCIKCGAEYQEGAQFCTKCGTRIEVMGNNAEDDAGKKGRKSDSPSVEEEKNAETVIRPISKSVNKSSEDSEAKARNDSVQKSSHQKNGVIAKKSKAPLVLLIAAPVVLIALVLIVGITSYFTIFSQSARDRREVNKQLKLAERYLDELDYEQAIAAYKAVLEIDPNNAEALAALNDVYEKWEESDPASADKIYEEALTYYASLNERAGTDVAATYIAGMEQKKGNSNGAADNMPATEHNLTVTVVGANETGAISGAEITISGTNISMSDESDGSGKADFAGISDGSVKISVSASGYNSRELEVSISGSDLNKTVALVPEISGDDAMVLLTWNGDHDLDLCAFNSSIKEYVSIGHPMDSEGNVFLYADHGADLQYEVIYIHNASAEMVRTFYVADAGKARNGDSSSMEADGVSVYVYNNTGLTYSSTADASQSAPLWCPCYYYAGVVYDQGDYIYDTTDEQYAWISFDEKDAYTADATIDDGWKQAYLEYIDKVISEHWDDYSDFYNADGYNATYDQVFYFRLIYIDSDDIPELIIGAGSEVIASYHNGKLQRLDEDDFMNPITGRYSGVTSFVEGEGKFIWSGGGNFSGEEIICSLQSSGFDQECVGYKEYSMEDIDYSHPDCYFWDDWDEYGNGTGNDYESHKCKNEADYEKKMSLYYDYSKATDDLGSRGMWFNYSEIVAYLSPQPQSAEAPADAPSDPASETGWKAAYLEILNKSIYTYKGYTYYPYAALIYVDGDAVPEFFVYCNGSGSSGIYTYSNGQVVTLFDASNDYSNLSYIPAQGLLSIERGVADTTWSRVIKWDGMNSEVLWSGEQDGGDTGDEYDDYYIYYVNDQVVSEDEYYRTLAATGWDQSKSVWAQTMSYEEMAALLSD